MQPNSQAQSSTKKKNKKKNKNKGGNQNATQATTLPQQQQQQQAEPQGAAAAGQSQDYAAVQNGHHSDSEEDGAELGAEMDGFHSASSSHPPPPSLTPATQAELLATANELYRQIEAAAAAALASTGGPNNPAGPPLSGQPNSQQANAHLRSFIKNALPLAAGLNGTSAGSAVNLSPEQMHMAAQQLAHVVQTTGWASLGLSAPPDLSSLRNASATDLDGSGTTIPLGSFTVPLHPHPDFQVTEHYEEADEDDLASEEDYSEDEDVEDVHHQPQQPALQQQAALAPQSQLPTTQSSSAKKKNKKKKKTALTMEHPSVPLTTSSMPPHSGYPAPVRKQPPAPTRSAVPVVPQLTNGHADAYAHSRNGAHNPSQKNTGQQAPNAPTTPASVRPANAAAQAQALRDRQQAAANAAAQAAALQQQSVYQPKASTSRSERDDIRDFWLGLSQSDRRHMVTIEKQSVLRKMKEVQRHNCACAVCGRKRNLIEQELEVLYNSYTTELETYAEKQRDFRDSNGKKSPPPGPGPFPGSIDPDVLSRAAATAPAAATAHHHHHPATTTATRKSSHSHHTPATAPHRPAAGTAPARTAEGDAGKNHSAACPRSHHVHPHDQYHDHDPSESESEGSEEEEDEDEEGEEGALVDPNDSHRQQDRRLNFGAPADGYEEEVEAAHKPVPGIKPTPTPAAPGAVGAPKPHAAATRDVFGGAGALAAKNGVLTVADDLLKNDGQKFLEMMENIAYKRIQREKELAQRAMEAEADEDSEEDYDEEDSEGDDEDEEDIDAGVPAEQRRDDGRRMFQIFAARMFEQRVLQAYREKVARERQEQLLMELAEEDQAAAGRDAKKLKDAQKKKAKKQAQKEKAEAERLKREADKKAAEEEEAAAALAKAEADRKRAAEQAAREERKREAKAAEAARKAAEKQKRAEKQLAEEERRRAEAEKQREKVAQDKAAAAAKKEAARVQREAAEKEKREKDKREKEKKEKAAAERKAAEEHARKERERQQAEARAAAQAKQAAQAAARAQVQQSPLQPTSILQPSPSSGNRPMGMPPSPVRGYSAGNNNNRAMPPTPVGLPPTSSPAGLSRGAPTVPLGVPHTPGKQPMPSPGPVGPFRGQPQQHQPPPPGFAPMSPFGARPPSSQGMMPMSMTPSATSESPTHSRPASTIAGMSASPMPFPQQSFGPIGLGTHPQPMGRPPLSQAQSLPSGSTSIFSSAPTATAMNGAGAPPGFRRPSNAHVAPIGSSSYGNIGVTAGQPMQRNTSGESARQPSAIGARPIGRPPPRHGTGQTSDEVDPAALRSPTPPLTFGSAALLDDDDEDALADSEHGGGGNGSNSSPTASSSALGGSYTDSSIWGGSGLWPAAARPQPPPLAVPEPQAPVNTRASILRARLAVICYELTKDHVGQSATSLIYHDWDMVASLLVQRFPDSNTATTEELIKCCELPADHINGGGSFSLKADPPRVLIAFQPQD